MLPKIKVVLVGAPSAGKTSMVLSYLEIDFPNSANYNFRNDTFVKCEGKSVLASFEDTYSSAEAEFVNYRRLVYPHTDIFVVCFSLISWDSFQHVETAWVPEINLNCPNVPMILVGTKLDLRQKALRDDQTVVNQLDGVNMARRIGARAYVECSSVTLEGLNNVFETAVSVVLNPDRPPQLCIVKPPKPTEPPVLATDLPLSQAYRSFIDNDQFSDVTFVLSDTRQVHAHKVILATNMACFYKTFINNKNALPSCFRLRNAETTEERTIIDTDLDPLVLQCILKCIYMNVPCTELEYSAEVVAEAVKFFTQWPRFSVKARLKLLTELACSRQAPLSDVNFQIGKYRVCAHKVLLTAVSEYFGAIFTSGLKESQLDVITLQDITFDDFTTLKEFLYSGRTSTLDTDNVINIIRLANKYNLSALITHCEVMCKEHVDSFDIWELYQLATAHNCHQLRAYLIWMMKVQYDTIADQSWFKKELEADVKQQVVAEQWPDPVYRTAVKEWTKTAKKTQQKSNSDCAIM